MVQTQSWTGQLGLLTTFSPKGDLEIPPPQPLPTAPDCVLCSRHTHCADQIDMQGGVLDARCGKVVWLEGNQIYQHRHELKQFKAKFIKATGDGRSAGYSIQLPVWGAVKEHFQKQAFVDFQCIDDDEL